uniref:Uncharacterized protein n=1 Tax=Lepeophtheirus salmonis TaxID=72036 RepID=A0A0K2VF71_LEPSM
MNEHGVFTPSMLLSYSDFKVNRFPNCWSKYIIYQKYVQSCQDITSVFFLWTFIKAKVSQPLVGADFLRSFDLLPDLLHRRLVYTSDFTSIPCKTSNISRSTYLRSVSIASDKYGKLLS